MIRYRNFDIKRQKQTSERTPIIIPGLQRCASNMKDAKRIIDNYYREMDERREAFYKRMGMT